MEAWSLSTLLLTFGGGLVGAAMGGLWAFIACAFFVMLGCIVVLGGGSDFILMQVGLGPVFGPHVGGFCSGIAASCYAVSKRNHPTGSGKDILSPLTETSWDVLVMGGVFALGAHALLQLLATVPLLNQFDVLALVVVISNLAARLIFLREMPWGTAESIREYGFLGTGNTAISWAPWMARPGRYIVIGLGVGLLSGAIAMGTRQVLLPMAAAGTISATGAFVVPLIMGWAIASFNLIALQLGAGAVQKVPIYHCMAILGALAFLLSGSLIVAGMTGMLAAMLQELMARLFYNHGTSHVDPPACAIALGTLVLNVLFKPEFLNLGKLL